MDQAARDSTIIAQVSFQGNSAKLIIKLGIEPETVMILLF